jgi:peptidoglycan hydrolase-like protein with peptidoglycan-binding domain
MKKSRKNFLIIAGLVVAAAIVFIIIKRKKAATATLEGTPTPAGTGTAAGNQATAPASLWPLQKGSRNTWVAALQQALNKRGARLVADGDFGQNTERALLYYTGKNTVSLTEFNKLFGR